MRRAPDALRATLAAGCAALAACAADPAAELAGAQAAELYARRCAVCHDAASGPTPTREALRGLAPEDIASALTEGAMQPQAEGLSRAQIRALATYLSARPFAPAPAAAPRAQACAQVLPRLQLAEPHWNGWGRDLENTRYQPAPGIVAADVPKLRLAWAYAYPGRSAYGQPSVVGDRLYVTGSTGRVSALDARSACEHWSYEAGTGVKSAVVVGALPDGGPARFAAFFGDQRAQAHAVDAESGRGLWKTKLDEHPLARITGSPAFHAGRVYFPVSSHEEGAAADPRYPCCSFRGSIVALDAQNGAVIWKAYAIREPARPSRLSSGGTQMYGPAGAAIWSAPTIDTRRGVVYAATGNSYTDVDTDGADAIVAFDLATGERKWVRQLTADDNFVLRCGEGRAGRDNCPEQPGEDFDFGSPPMLKTLPGGRQILLGSQKSGTVHALDPDDAGAVLWQTRVGRGSALGGVQFGPGADAERLYVAISDVAHPDPLPGLSALALATGEPLWSTPTPSVSCAWGRRRCARGQSAAVTVIPGIVFSGALDGHLRAYSSADGSIVWDFDTGGAFDTVNGVRAEGGSIDGGGATLARGMLYVNSGYGLRSKPGRVLLAFTVEGK
jgi:polyvinyl alcohol dehydrogenase (cytochrome)